MANLCYTAQEVAEMLGISKSKAYIMIKELNKEMKEKNNKYIIVSGKVNKKYLQERIYGYTDK
ncbi:MAG: helix-turn-helix domain-containing protein [Ruminococcus flavefaciens]|nr:helix-turn-helix domain-containing protein [Ruminococcus flavefaciens]MCM1229299.1 helix-turn-helix domain-containing protein [Ruminococcus flavefaciens]